MKILTARPHRLLAACVDRLGEATARGEGCMFLVPSQYTLQAELEIMERLHVSGSFLIDVLSPKRLQSRVFELAGMPKQTLFDERGKCMVLSSIIEAQKDELSVYRGAAQNGSSGFTARMSNMIASLKRSGLPVWHTLGFNPHIYMTFACPLSLGQESECECVDVKTEAEAPDFEQWKAALNAIMPAGIVITHVGPVQMKADLIAYACYRITYPAAAAAALDQYNALESAPVEKHGKKGNKIIELKDHIPQVEYTTEGDSLHIELCMPAAQELNLNPSLLTGFLEEKFGLPAVSANILRKKFLTADKQLFV